MSALAHQQDQRKDSVKVMHLQSGWDLGQELPLAVDTAQLQSLSLAVLGLLV